MQYESDRPEARYLLQAFTYEAALRKFLRRYAPNEADVGDLLHETYARLLVAGRPGAAPIRSPRSFTFQVARNVALDWLRRHSVVDIQAVAEIESLPADFEHSPVEESVNARQELELLVAAVNTLSPRRRQIFTLQRVYGMSAKEVAKKLGLSILTVEQHAKEGLCALVTALLSRGTDAPPSVLERIRARRPR